MRRREFLGALGGVAAAWPVELFAQHRSLPTLGFIRTTSPQDSAWLVAAVRKGLTEAGFVEDHNIKIEYRYAQNQYGRLPEIAAELVRQNVALIVATGGTVAALAAKAATSKIPIVFTTGDDAVKVGLVASYNRPGGNITGISVVSGELAGKRLELLRDLMPNIRAIALIVNPKNPNSLADTDEVQKAAQALGLKVTVLHAHTAAEISRAFDALKTPRLDGLYVSVDTFLLSERGRITTLAASHAIPAVYVNRDYAISGGLISYGVDWTDVYRQAGIYAGRILKGEKPSNLPVLLPSKFQLVINVTSAKALGLTVPPTLLARADEVVE